MSVDEAWAEYRRNVVSALEPIPPNEAVILKSVFYAGFAKGMALYKDAKTVRKSMEQILKELNEPKEFE